MKSVGIIKREKTELENKIYEDIQSEIRKYYDSEEIEYKDKDEPKDTIIDFFAYLYRLIPVIKRKVHYSEELLSRINSNDLPEEHIKILKMYEDAFSTGEDMNIFLSNNTKKSRETDFLRYTWHLYHLHMSGKFVENKEQMKNNRSDTQLLCIINLNDVYFVDIIPHPTKAEEYFNIRSLEIILKNGWMEKIGFFEITDMIPGTLEPKITDDKDIFNIYSTCSANIAFEFHGKGYCSLELLNCTRRPYAAIDEMTKINREIYKLNSIKGSYIGFQLECNDKGISMGLVKFMTPTGETNFYNIF